MLSQVGGEFGGGQGTNRVNILPSPIPLDSGMVPSYSPNPLDKPFVCQNSIRPISKIISSLQNHTYLPVKADKVTEINFLGWWFTKVLLLRWQERLPALWFMFSDNIHWTDSEQHQCCWHFLRKPRRSIPTIPTCRSPCCLCLYTCLFHLFQLDHSVGCDGQIIPIEVEEYGLHTSYLLSSW